MDVTRTSTRNRLKLLAAACTDHARRLRALLAPLDAAGAAAAPETYAALGPVLAPGQGLTSYYANVHRDWAWGESENESALAAVTAALGGSGAGPHARARRRRRATCVRPARGARARGDRRRRRQSTLCSRRAAHVRGRAARALRVSGRAPRPRCPRRAAHARGAGAGTAGARLRAGRCDAGAVRAGQFPHGRHALAHRRDRRRPRGPRRPRSTGWLAPEGRWVNTGTLFFQQRDAVQCYAAEEVREVVADAGFAGVRWHEERMPYLALAGESPRAHGGLRYVRRDQEPSGAIAPPAARARVAGQQRRASAVAARGRVAPAVDARLRVRRVARRRQAHAPRHCRRAGAGAAAGRGRSTRRGP